MFGLLANIFGYVLNFIYNFVGNYGIAIIIFTIILRGWRRIMRMVVKNQRFMQLV